MAKIKAGDYVKVTSCHSVYKGVEGVVEEVDYSYCFLWPMYVVNGVRFDRSELELVETQDDGQTEGQEVSQEEEYEYYKYYYKGIKLDPYRIITIYDIKCPAQQHAIKKLLRAGNSIKDLKQDIREVIDTLERKLEMMEEDENV